jgi:hypothetical protein
MSGKTTTTYSGVNLSSVLFIVFLILKLTGNIDWNWWWITSPLWIPAALLIIVGILMLCIKAIIRK